MTEEMICTTVIATIGRESLGRAVQSVLNQEFDPQLFEVIVVNDSGRPLVHADWMGAPNVKILETNRHNRSVARNTGAAIARGRYLHFLDDDDWMLPGAFKNLWKGINTSGAGWITGGFNLVDNQGKLIAAITPNHQGNCFVQVLASEWMPLQASWIDLQEFFKAGGFTSLEKLLGGYEDIDLSRKIAWQNEFVVTPAVVASIRFGDQGSTTDYENYVAQNRQSRELTLDLTGAYFRLRNSANENRMQRDYWRGRIVYYYLASIRWNFRDHRPLKSLSRLLFSMIAFTSAGPSVFRCAFWDGVLRQHINQVRSMVSNSKNNPYQNTVWKY